MHWQRLTSFDHAVTAIFSLVVFTTACLIPVQSDTWWHLRAGEEMWTRQFVMLADEFSYTVRGVYWPNHEWLADVVFYAVFRAGGLPLLALCTAALITASVLMSWRLMRGPATSRLLVMALAIPSVAPVWTVRPHVFTLALTMLVLHLLLRQVYWPLPLLFMLWANLHGGVAIGLVVLGSVAIAEVWTEGRSRMRPLTVVTCLCAAATLATPLGIDLWTTIPESIQKSMANGILEWRPPLADGWRHLPFWVIAAGLVATVVGGWRRGATRDDAALTLVALALLPLAVRYNRNIPPFLLVAVPVISRELVRRGVFNLVPSRGEPRLGNAVLVAVFTCACAGTVALGWIRPLARLAWHPIAAPIVDAVRACRGRLYNRFDDGGYLIWFAKDTPVFVDNRQDPYPLAFLQEHLHRETSGEFEPVFARYGIRCAFLPPASPTAERLVRAGWHIRARDKDWMVFERATPP